MNNNLCLFYSKPGHIATNCLKAATTKARAVMVSTTPDNNSVTTESKNLVATLRLQHWTRVALTLLVPLQSLISMRLLFFQLLDTPTYF